MSSIYLFRWLDVVLKDGRTWVVVVMWCYGRGPGTRRLRVDGRDSSLPFSRGAGGSWHHGRMGTATFFPVVVAIRVVLVADAQAQRDSSLWIGAAEYPPSSPGKRVFASCLRVNDV